MNKPNENKRLLKINTVEALLVGIVVFGAILTLFVKLPETNSFFTSKVDSGNISMSSIFSE